MIKVALNYLDINKELVSPGNIYWRKASGDEVVLCVNGKLIPHDIIQRLLLTNQYLLIDNYIDFNVHSRLIDKFSKYRESDIFKDKLERRKEINFILMEYYFYSAVSQLDLNRLCFKVFFHLDKKLTEAAIKKDHIYFNRSLTIASATTISAFLMGYYDDEFLVNLFNELLLNQINIGHELDPNTRIEILKSYQSKATLEPSDLKSIESFSKNSSFLLQLLFEKLNGTGPLGLKIGQLNDLEVLLCTFNYYYKFKNEEHANILSEINTGAFPINLKIKNLIKRNFDLLLDTVKDRTI